MAAFLSTTVFEPSTLLVLACCTRHLLPITNRDSFDTNRDLVRVVQKKLAIFYSQTHLAVGGKPPVLGCIQANESVSNTQRSS